MRVSPQPRLRLDLTALLVLALLLFRAYIPAGFMPAQGTPFLLELCPAGFGQMPAHHLHHGSSGHGHFDNCPFGSIPAAGPICDSIAYEAPGPVLSYSVIAFETLRSGARPQSTNQARAPPAHV